MDRVGAKCHKTHAVIYLVMYELLFIAQMTYLLEERTSSLVKNAVWENGDF